MNSYRVERLGEESCALWDSFVLGHPLGTVFHTTQWRSVLEQGFSNLKGYIVALRDANTGRIAGGIPFYLLRARWRHNRVISVPHACLCQPLARDPEDLLLLLTAVCEQARSMKAVSVEFRWLRSDWNVEHQSTTKKFLHHYIGLNTPLEKLWQSLSRTAVRRMVSKAEDSGMTVTNANHVWELRLFHDLLTQTRHRLGLPATPFHLLHQLWATLNPEHRTLLLANRKGETVAGVFCTKAGRTFMLDHYGERKDVRGCGVNSLLYWRALSQAHTEGFDRFSFGRTGRANESLSAYKRHWNVTEEEVTYREIQLEHGAKAKSRLTDIIPKDRIRGVLRRLPMPVYRIVSSVFYRNMA